MLYSEKVNLVDEFSDIYKNSTTVIVTHYHKLTVSDLTELRKDLRAFGGKFQIIKNTLAKLALEKANIDVQMKNMFVGPVAIAYSTDPVKTAKTITSFAKKFQALQIIGGVIDNSMIKPDQISAIAKLPALPMIQSKIVGLLNTPAMNIIQLLQSPAIQIVNILKAYSQKQGENL